MSLLSIVQNTADVVGIPRPSAVAAGTDAQTRQLFALAKIEGKALMDRHRWQALATEVTHTTLAAELQGTLSSITPGYAWFINGTMWDRTTKVPIYGPLNSEEWQEKKAQVSTGPYFQFRVRIDNLYFYPAPAAGLTVALEYGSKYWCQSSGGTAQETWVADTDTGKLSEHLMTLGLRWRWLQMKGLDYGEAFRQYEMEVNQAIARDGARRTIYLDEGERGFDTPTVRAPDGSWNL